VDERQEALRTEYNVRDANPELRTLCCAVLQHAALCCSARVIVRDGFTPLHAGGFTERCRRAM
jgi:hypothetical protein